MKRELIGKSWDKDGERKICWKQKFPNKHLDTSQSKPNVFFSYPCLGSDRVTKDKLDCWHQIWRGVFWPHKSVIIWFWAINHYVNKTCYSSQSCDFHRSKMQPEDDVIVILWLEEKLSDPVLFTKDREEKMLGHNNVSSWSQHIHTACVGGFFLP